MHVIRQTNQIASDPALGCRAAEPERPFKSYADASGVFTIVSGRSGPNTKRLLRMSTYSAALAFINGDLQVRGDIFAAVRLFLRHEESAVRHWALSLLARLETALKRSRAATRNIQFHYDRSNAFYGLFLDSKMLYSAAHFDNLEMSLEEAQEKKLERICSALQLNPEERFLDIGCGWGALVMWAAEHHGTLAHGCTLSTQQLQFCANLIQQRNLQARVTVDYCDYRQLTGQYDKIASVGMFEHVGRQHLPTYFKKVSSLLSDGGYFLNRGILRPEGISENAETLFIQRKVFPGGDLVHLADLIREGERAGFELVEFEDFREQYNLTCRAWVERLRANEEAARQIVGDETYRTWILYLAASAVNFEDGEIDAAQVTFVKRNRPRV